MNDFMAWLKRVAGPRITIHFHAPVVFNLFGGKRVGKLGKDRRIPALLGNAPPQAQRPCLKIGLASLRRDRMLVQADPRIRAGWQAVTAEISRQQKRI